MGGTGVPGGASVLHGGNSGRRPDPDEGVPSSARSYHASGFTRPLASPRSLRGSPVPSSVAISAVHPSRPGASLPSSVSFSGHSGDRSVGRSSVVGYRGGHSSSSGPGPRGGTLGRLSSSSYSIPSALRHRGSAGSVGDESDWAESASDDITLSPIPLPADKFVLSPIKSGEDYLKMWDLILFWLRTPGFSTAHDDSLLVTDTRNSIASRFWEGQLRTALKDGCARHLFENTDTKYFGKGFEMLQVLEDNFRPSSISNSFTTLLALFNDTQGDKEGLHEFRSRFEGHLGALSWSSVAIPPILQVMLFLRALHARYGDLLTQFASKQKDLSTASIDSVLSDAKFMDEFTVVGAGGKPKPGHPPPSHCW
jgi:hypothetical protein